jgi:transposase
MILLTHNSPILLGVAPSDFRRGIDGFVAQCRNTLEKDPSDGTIFIFINRARTMIRALSYDGTGYWLMTKRLSRGKFSGWPTGQEALSPASARQLRLLISDGAFSPVGHPASTPDDVHATPLASLASSTTLYSNPATSRASQAPLS